MNMIRSWSFSEVREAGSINFTVRSNQSADGLFYARIFGPVKIRVPHCVK